MCAYDPICFFRDPGGFARKNCLVLTGFGVPGGNRFGEQENDKEHRQLEKANRNRNRNIGV